MSKMACNWHANRCIPDLKPKHLPTGKLGISKTNRHYPGVFSFTVRARRLW